MPLNFGAQTRGALCRLTSHVKRERERERERESGAFHALWPSATAAVTNNTSNTNNTNERTNERTNKQTNKQTHKHTNNSRKFPVGLDLTNVIDMQSSRASCGIRAHDLPLADAN